MDNVKLFSNKVWIAEDQSDPDALIAKIVICDFSVNKNGVMLNRATITDWMASLVNSPLVGKIKAKSNGEIDFTSHNATVVTRVDENGNEYTDVELNTDAFGTFTSVEIETIDGVECIVATARVWKRFYDATNLIVKRIKEGTLSTSWEISVEQSEKKILGGALVKVIDKGRFIGHALLSSQTAPAYDISRVLEVAAKDENDDEQLCSALIRDVMKLNNDGNEVEKMEDEKTLDTSAEEVNTGGVENGEEEGKETSASNEEAGAAEGQEKEVAEPTVEKADLTMYDIRRKVEEAIVKKLDRWIDMLWLFPESKIVWVHVWDANETDLFEFSYTVENDEIILGEPVEVKLSVSPRTLNASYDEKVSALIDAQKQINELSATVESLAPFKEAAETAAREKAEAQRKEAVASLRKYAEESGMLSKEELDSGEIAELINNLKETDVKVLIADRIVGKKKEKSTETASEKKQPKVRAILSDGAPSDPGSIFMTYIRK